MPQQAVAPVPEPPPSPQQPEPEEPPPEDTEPSQVSSLTEIVHGIDDVLDVLTMIDEPLRAVPGLSGGLLVGGRPSAPGLFGLDCALETGDKATTLLDCADSVASSDDTQPAILDSLPALPKETATRKRACMVTPRWSVSREQKRLLEEFFKTVQTPSRGAREALAQQMGVTPQQVKVWFRNQRQRIRLSGGPKPC